MEQLIKAKELLNSKGIANAVTGIVLGTGLHQLISYVDVKQTIPCADIPGFPVATVEFHKGNLVYGTIAGKSVLIMQGRFHAYEGYTHAANCISHKSDETLRNTKTFPF